MNYYIYIKAFGILKCVIVEDYGEKVKIKIPDLDQNDDLIVFRKLVYKTKEEAQVKEYKKQTSVLIKQIETSQKNLDYIQDMFDIKELKKSHPELFLV